MEKYPEDVLTISKQGKKEIRILEKRGKFVIYGYKDLFFGKLENKKKLCLISESGEKEYYFLIPLKDGRILMIPDKNPKENIKVWNEKEKRAEDLWL